MIAIIGGGISGLALAHELAARDIPFKVFEREHRTGGVIRSEVVDGHLLEHGPQRTRLTQSIRSLIGDLDLTREVVTAPVDLPLLIYHSGRLREVPFSATALLRGDLLNVPAKLRILLEPFTAGAAPDETVAHYFVRKLGRDAYENLAGPLYGGLYASDPADMIVGLSLAGTLRDLGVRRSLVGRALRARGRVGAPAAISFRHGMQTLTDALHARHTRFIHMGVEVRGIVGTAAGFDLHTSAGTEHVSQVVVTTPAVQAAHLAAECSPAAAAALAQLHYNPLAVVHLHTRAPVPRALGFQVGFGETLVTRGVTFNDALFERRGVYTAYLGGAQHPEVVDWDDARLGARAASEFKTVTGARADVIRVTRTAMPAWDRTWRALADLPEASASVKGLHFCANWESRPGLPGRLLRASRLADTLTSPLD